MSNEIKWTKDQKRAIEHTGNILISASAGSGKTTVLVARVLHNIIVRHIPINRMLVLTFTEVASLEMKDKITEKLIEEAKKGGEYSKLLKEQISLIPFSQISTIHSFCMEIARSYFDYLNINPTFDMLSDMDIELYKAKAFNNVIDSVSEDDNSPINLNLLVNVLTDNRSTQELYSIIKKIQDNTETQVNPEFLAGQVANMFSKKGVKQIEDIIASSFTTKVEAVVSELEDMLPNAKENLDYINNLLDSIEVLRKTDSLEKLVSYAECYQFTGRLVGKKSTEVEGFSDRLSGIKKETDKIVASILTLSPYSEQKEMFIKTKEVLDNLVLFTNEFIKEYNRLKNKDSKLDFNDLERYAIRVLQNEDNAKEIQDRYDAVFVDEYQDTNYIQEYIVSRVSKSENFYVGDLKQSIYGFRLCEPKIIKDKYEKYLKTGEGEVVNLNSNYRSSQNVIDFVNQIFDQIMTEKSSMVDYKGTSRLDKGIKTVKDKVEKNNDCKIVIFKEEKAEPKEYKGVYNVLEDTIEEKIGAEDYEAQYMVNEINNLVNNTLIDGEKCRYKDIAILVQSKPGFQKILERLEKFIPLNMVDFEKSLSKQDIDLINTILSLALNIKQDKPLAMCLLSYFGGLTEQDLADIRIKYPKILFYDAVSKYKNEQKDDISAKLTKFFNLLDTIRFTSSFKDVPTLFRNLVSGGFDLYLTSLKDGEERLESINNYIIELSSNTKLYNIIDYLEYTKTNNIVTKTTEAKNKDAVTVMTIHKSKGLEFPIVFLPCLNKMFNGDDKKQSFLYNSHIGAGIYYYDNVNYIKKDSLGRLAVKQVIDKESNMEQIRLFYVALTRAKQKLYLLATSNKDLTFQRTDISSCNCYLDMLKYAIYKDPTLMDLVEVKEPIELDDITKRTFKITKPDKIYTDLVSSAINFTYPHADATTMLAKHSATSINRSKEITSDAYKIVDENEAVKTGIIYHKVMQYIDFNCYNVSEVTTEINSMVDSGVLTPNERKLVDDNLIFKVLNLNIINIASRNKCYREKEFLVKINASSIGLSSGDDEILVQGVMDLLITGDKNYLVDYKYSSSSDEKLAETYEKQFYVYETAYKTLFGANIDQKIIVNLKKGTEIYLK